MNHNSQAIAITKDRSGHWLKRQWDVLRSARWLGLGQYGGNYRRMDRLYLVEDPWGLASRREAWRFELTNAAIARHVPDCDSLLEIGTGEGIQTLQFQKVARRVTGIEVSPLAAARARAVVPDVEILVGPAEDVTQLVGDQRFDLITACEMLYFVPEAAQLLEDLQALAPRVLVTAYEKRAKLLAHHFCGPGWARLDDIVSDGTHWRCYLWTRPQG